MTYFNNTHCANFYPTTSASGELDGYPFLSQTSAAEEVDSQAYGTFADCWGMARQPGPMVGLPTSHLAATNYESMTSADSYAAPTNGYGQSTYPGHHWPVFGQPPQYHYPGFSSQGGPFYSMVASQTPTVVQTPSSVPLDCWGPNQSGPSTSTFYTENVHTYHQLSTGPTRTGLTQTGRFQPYGMSHTRPNEYWNAEAGLSIMVAPPAQYVHPPTWQPSGGIPETTADAETTQTFTEEDKVPTPKRTRLPRGEGRPRNHRVREKKDIRKLCDWVQRWDKLQASPSVNEALAVAVRIIPTIRPVVNPKPCLHTTPGKSVGTRSKRAKEEFERREVERRLYQELSRYYPLGNRAKWVRQDLLMNVRMDLENLPPLPEPSNKSPP